MNSDKPQDTAQRALAWLKRDGTYTVPNWLLVLAGVVLLALIFD